MAKPIVFAAQARAEVNAAARRYGDERPELKVEFHVAIKDALGRMVRLSRHLGTPPLVDPGLGIKRVFVERFPFSSTSSSSPIASACLRWRTHASGRSTGGIDARSMTTSASHAANASSNGSSGYSWDEQPFRP